MRSQDDEFGYLAEGQMYFDSACQTLRPQSVIDAECDYYYHYNACGGRVKYRWGEEVDKKVHETRMNLIDYLGKSARDYTVAFTLNTSYGINLVLNQIDLNKYKNLVTSEIEHNSVMLPTMESAHRHGLKHIILSRNEDGSLLYESNQIKNSVVVLNCTSNIDGRRLLNARQLADEVHTGEGMLLLDAAQGLFYQKNELSQVDFDCLVGSSHKMYGPSLGFIVIKKKLLKTVRPLFIGGGMVEVVHRDSYDLIADDELLYSRLEPGLQLWSAIIGFNAALKWLNSMGVSAISSHRDMLSKQLFEGLSQIDGLELINNQPSPVVSWYSKKIDAHQMAIIYSAQDIMVRSGYFCCHYYLQDIKKLPSLVRVSIGLHNTEDQIEKLLSVTKTILTTFR